MTYYVRFRDDSEYVVCAIDMKDAIDMASDMQKTNKKSIEAIECKEVAEK